jgi:hypothetical protein
MFHGAVLEPPEPLSNGCGAIELDPANDLPTELKTASDERAAIAEFDDGLDRNAAERLAWNEVTDLVIPDQSHQESDVSCPYPEVNQRLQELMAKGIKRSEAEARAWGEAINKWHRCHGKKPDPTCCAGCGQRHNDGFRTMQLLNGAVVHLGDDHGLNCLIEYGRRWRTAAADGLRAMDIAGVN